MLSSAGFVASAPSKTYGSSRQRLRATSQFALDPGSGSSAQGSSALARCGRRRRRSRIADQQYPVGSLRAPSRTDFLPCAGSDETTPRGWSAIRRTRLRARPAVHRTVGSEELHRRP